MRRQSLKIKDFKYSPQVFVTERLKITGLSNVLTGAWVLMVLIAMFSNLLLGYRERSSGRLVLLVLPMIASIAFFLIADIDSPYVGLISVVPHNSIATSEAMRSHH